MSSDEMSPQLISKIVRIINHDIEAMGLLAEVAEDIRDPTIRALITSIIGDENGHIRFFTLLLSPVTIKAKNCKRDSLNLKENKI
jgi:rubrerythrin